VDELRYVDARSHIRHVRVPDLFPAGLMKSYLTLRTENAWVHMRAFHAFTSHVIVDTRLIVKGFNTAGE
jgi:hypothetical protein